MFRLVQFDQQKTMTRSSGPLHKMTVILDDPVRYSLSFGDGELDFNALLGESLSLTFTGRISCIHGFYKYFVQTTLMSKRYCFCYKVTQ